MAGTFGLTAATQQAAQSYAAQAGVAPSVEQQSLAQLQQQAQQKATAPNGKGTLFGLHMPNLGIGKFFGSLGGALTGIENTADAALHGNLAPAAQMVKGLASSFAGTAIDVAAAPLGPFGGQATQGLRSNIGDILADLPGGGTA